MAQKKQKTNLAHIYQHTHIAVYLVGSVTVASLVYDSTQVQEKSICGLPFARMEEHCARAVICDMYCFRGLCKSTSSIGNGSTCMVSTFHQLNAGHSVLVALDCFFKSYFLQSSQAGSSCRDGILEKMCIG